MATKAKVKGGLKHYQVVTVTTAATGLSDIIDIGSFCPRSIQMSTAWTTADITFMGAVSSTDYMGSVRKTTAGTEVTHVTSAVYTLTLDPEQFAGLRYLQIRSGTTTTPVAQAAERVLYLGLTPVDNLD